MMTYARKHLTKIVFFMALIGVTLAFFVNYLYRQEVEKGRADIEQIQLSFNPPSATVTENQTFETTISAYPGVSFSAVGYEYTVLFDQTKLRVNHITYLLGTGIGDSDATLTTVNQSGRMRLQASVPGHPMTIGTPVDTVRLEFTALSATGTTIAIDSESERYFERNRGAFIDQIQAIGGDMHINGGGAITPTPTCDPRNLQCGRITPTPTCDSRFLQCGRLTNTPTPPVTTGIPTPSCDPRFLQCGRLTPVPGENNVTLIMKVRLQGITTRPRATDPLMMRVVVSGGALLTPLNRPAQFNLNDDGTWTGRLSFNINTPAPTGLPETTNRYSVFIKPPKHVQKRICDNNPTETRGGTYRCSRHNITINLGDNNLDFSRILLLAGDLPVTEGAQNGVIDSEDTTFIRQNFGSGDPGILAKADLNLDGNVDTQDFSLVIAALSIKYDDPIEGQ